MNYRFTENAQAALNAAAESASKLGHTYIGSEHILMGLLYKGTSIAANLLAAKGITYEKVVEAIGESIGTNRSTACCPNPRRVPHASSKARPSLPV